MSTAEKAYGISVHFKACHFSANASVCVVGRYSD